MNEEHERGGIVGNTQIASKSRRSGLNTHLFHD
jgi:hypothetical protein